MIWLTWRQFRVQALTALAVLTVLAVYLVVLGYRIRHAYDTDVVGCLPEACERAEERFLEAYTGEIAGVGAFLVGLPGLVGIFWGAPLIARELEERTHRLVWNQSVTRTRWLATKLGSTALAGLAAAGLLSLLLTWSASRYDQVRGDRFEALNFASRNIVPLGYAVFAVVLGTVIGLLLRRTVPAMALTLVLFAAVQVVMSNGVRVHLMPPVTTTVAFDAEVTGSVHGMMMSESDAWIEEYALPGTWSLNSESQLFNPDGTPFTIHDAEPCMGAGDRQAQTDCQVGLNLSFSHEYHPADRYWPFQWIELSIFLLLALLTAGSGFWWIRNRPS
jgi:ABC-type transport system involved in multi-copper enzyme maturation permease subunit